MKTLIIPAAGKSSRFPNTKPKWMLTHPQGKLMIEICLDDRVTSQFDKIVVAINPEHEKLHDCEYKLEQVFKSLNLSNKSKVYICPKETSSCPETVSYCLSDLNIKGEICIKDCDNLLIFKHESDCNYIVGADIYKNKISNLQQKSFLVTNDINNILDVKEKLIISNNICCGAYGFSDSALFQERYQSIKSSGINFTRGELYISHILSSLIKLGEVVKFSKAKEYIDFGTIQEWEKERLKYQTLFIDVDGVLVKNKGKYGKENWETEDELIEFNIKKIKTLSNDGAQIILTSSRDEKSLIKVKTSLEREGVNIHHIVPNCLHSKRIIINDYAPTNPFPSCEAVNIERNGNIPL